MFFFVIYLLFFYFLFIYYIYFISGYLWLFLNFIIHRIKKIEIFLECIFFKQMLTTSFYFFCLFFLKKKNSSWNSSCSTRIITNAKTSRRSSNFDARTTDVTSAWSFQWAIGQETQRCLLADRSLSFLSLWQESWKKCRRCGAARVPHSWLDQHSQRHTGVAAWTGTIELWEWLCERCCWTKCGHRASSSEFVVFAKQHIGLLA